MAAQVNSPLEGYYAAAANRARRFVASRYMLEECAPNSPDYPKSEDVWREVWRLRVTKLAEPQDFILAIPTTFPDHLPKAYLPARTIESIKQIPHLDSNRFLCTYDEVASKPNADDPGQMALHVLERAITIFKDGVSKVNQSDYAEEMQAYWGLNTDILALSLIEPQMNLLNATMLELQPAWRGYTHLFAPSEDEGRKWLLAVDCDSKVEIQTVPFFHLQTLGGIPLPSTNGEIYRLLQRHDTTLLKRLTTHLQRSPRPSAILFSAPTAINAGRMLGAWWHPLVAHEVYRGPAHQERYSEVAPGFRSVTSRLAVIAELSVRHKQDKIIRATVERVDTARLFERTIGDTHSALELGVNMIGCGSLGSVAAACLAQSSMADRFCIVDHETLRPENVQRHYCGMSDIGEYKAEATARRLRAHFPHVECETHTKDVLEMIRTSPTTLATTSLTIVTVADIAIERRLNQLFKTTPAFGDAPICFMWVEPHMFAGHALFLRRTQAGCFECAFDEHFRYKHRVLKNPALFSRREAGCQSTFIPYSGVDATQFIAAASRFLINALKTPENKIFTWIGDVEEARARGDEVEGQWEGAASFTTYTSVLSSSKVCRVCHE